ncbi:fibronectin type III domain-containing protein [Marinobacter lutaoensis]|uniref:fibronectin type III domain-containing protein n=1 Tax=Marinobacter lutaoensis TaxID=135739 RepID=UPI001FEA4182|nr:fibronectin type III domain-containing protein [Marinobacter lutaoensis]
MDKTATLSWLAPDRRVNGEQISPNELISYTIRYGQDPNNLDQSVVLDDVSGQVSVSYTIEDLDVGTWYFTIQVQDASGLMSEPSEAVSKTIQS